MKPAYVLCLHNTAITDCLTAHALLPCLQWVMVSLTTDKPMVRSMMQQSPLLHVQLPAAQGTCGVKPMHFVQLLLRTRASDIQPEGLASVGITSGQHPLL
jgi:hypothetical protein